MTFSVVVCMGECSAVLLTNKNKNDMFYCILFSFVSRTCKYIHLDLIPLYVCTSFIQRKATPLKNIVLDN
jgi:hypothetical protein